MSAMWRTHFPLMRTMALLVSLFVLIGFGVALTDNAQIRQGLNKTGWQWQAADSFEASVPPADGWIPYQSEKNRDSRYYWLRIPIPSNGLRDPHLWIFNAVAVRVFSGQTQMYRYDPAQHHHRINTFLHWNLAPIPSPSPSSVTLLLDTRSIPLPAPEVKLVDKGELMTQIIHKDVYTFILSGLFLFGACIALGLYMNRRDKLFAYFALLSLCGCYSSTVHNDLLQLFWNQPWLGYLENGVFPLGMYFFVSIADVLFASMRFRLLRLLRHTLLIYAALTTVSAFAPSISLYAWLQNVPLLVLFLFTVSVLFWTIFAAYLKRKDTESVWMMSGFLIVTLVALLHVLRYNWTSLSEWLDSWFPQMPFDSMSLGLFLFMICLIRVFIYRFSSLNRELADFNRSLEHKIQTRTNELHERSVQLQVANARLAASMRENSEVMAETMVLEERHRITGSVHDTVGHVLAATIAQLEAAKRLVESKPQEAETKMDAAQQLVRQGLEQIRMSVRLLKEDATQYDLPAAIGALVRDTAAETGATIETKLGSLPEAASLLQKKLLFQALQEGLSGGTNQGRFRKFQLSLDSDKGSIRMKLKEEGRRDYVPALGIGLRMLAEKAEQLGGQLRVVPDRTGYSLTLILPTVTSE